MTLLIVLVVIAVVVLAAAIGGSAYALHRQNRVVRGISSPAPTTWLISGRREAKLHRRLRLCGRRLELVQGTDGVVDVIARLRIELVELDGYLVTVAQRPSRARRADRRVIYERVAEVEDLVRRIEERTRAEPISLTELSERLDALEAADEELRELGSG